MMPDNIYELRTGRARRSVITLHRRWQQDVLRQVRRHASGRYAWLPQLNQRINRP